MLVTSLSIFGQSKKDIGGRILDDSGNPLPGASVIEKDNPNNGVISDFNGEFVISVNEDSKELTISFLGFETKTVQIDGNYLNITLSEEANQLDNVVVKGFSSVASKARVRTQAIQSLPETTVAINAQTIEATGINNLQSFTSQVSNVLFNEAEQPGTNFLTVRGISQIRNAESPVAVVIDGMTLPDANAMNMSLYDIELLEFVKGPQGTLYGKNAIAGAVNIVTKEPTNTNKTKVMLSTGNGGLFGAGLSSSGAIVKNKFYYSIAGRYSTFDGLITNTTLNEKVDFSDEYNIRAKLKYRFSPRWSATYVQDNFKVDGGAAYYATKTDILDPTIPVLADDDYDKDPISDYKGFSELSNSLSSFKIEGNLNKLKLQSVTSFNSTSKFFSPDFDYSQYPFGNINQTSDSDTFSQEIRLTSNSSEDSKLNYTFGMLYQKSDRYLYTETISPPGSDPSVGTDDDNTIETFAAFGFMDFKLSSKFTLSAGVRVDSDKFKNDSRIINTVTENSITVWQPKFSLAYQISKDVLAYANYGRGYRSGGFNAFETAKFGKTYEAEFTNNYEIGLKTSFLNNRIIFNNAFYRIDFENQQQYTFVPVAPSQIGIYNFEETKITGFESEIKFRATNNLDFFASVGFNNGEIEKGTYNRFIELFNYVDFEEVDVSGNASPFTLKSTFQIGGNANFKLGEKSNLGFHVNIDNRGTQYWDSLEQYKQDPYTLVNARVNLKLNKIGLTLWANNIFDTKYNTEFFPTDEYGFNNLRNPNTPTTVGVDLSYRF